MDDKPEQSPLETPTPEIPEIPEVHEIIPEVREGGVRSEQIRVSDTLPPPPSLEPQDESDGEG